MEGLLKQPHISLSADQVYPSVLIVNDAEEAEMVAKMTDKYEEIAYNREYRSFDCTYKGVSFNVLSAGTGSSGAGIAFKEVMYLGAKNVIMATGAYSVSDKVNTGDIVIPQAAVRDEGYTKFVMEPYFPAVADPEIYMKLVKSAKQTNTPYKKGITITAGALYTSEEHKDDYKPYTKFGANILDLEAATLMIVSSMENAKCATIHTILGHYDNIYSDHPMADVDDIKKTMYQVCLEAICA